MASISRTIVIAVAVILVIFGAFILIPSEPVVVQPIAYNHKLHVEGEGLECVDCHTYVEKLPRATLPDLAICLDCHDVEPISEEESTEEAILIEHIEQGREIAWQRIYSVPDHVYFSHRRHVVSGEIECATCHGDVGSFTEPVTLPFFDVTMDACMDCHRDNGVTNDCLSCHR